MRNKIKEKQMQQEKQARHINILGIMRNNSLLDLTQSHLQYNYITL